MMVSIAERVRKETALPAGTSWFITDPDQANGFVREGRLDVVFLGRQMLENPNWPYAAARKLGVEKAAWATLAAPYAHWLDRYRAA